MSGSSFIADPVVLDNATIEPAEPFQTAHSVWYSWTAPDDLNVTFALTGSTGQIPGIHVYYGNSFATLCSILQPVDQRAAFVAVKGVTYQIALDQTSIVAKGTAILSMTSTPFGSGGMVIGPDLPTSNAPLNDQFLNEKALTALPLTVVVDNAGATTETAEPAINGQDLETLWYSYTAPTDGLLNIASELTWEAGLSSITLFYGDSLQTLNFVYQYTPYGQNTGNKTPPSVPIKAGSTYHIAVGVLSPSFKGDNQQVLTFALAPLNSSGTLIVPDAPTTTAPTNDNFVNRHTLTGARLSVLAFVAGASNESFEPADGFHTVWYSWGTDQAGSVTITTGTANVEKVSVFTGSEVGSLVPVATNGNTTTTLTFPAQSGVTYQIALGTWAAATTTFSGCARFDLAGPGVGTVNVTPTAPDSQFVNLSNRSVVAVGGNMNPGFVITGTAPKKVLIRAVGPGLATTFGVPNVMADPQITVYSSATQLAIGSNNDWSSDPSQVSTLTTAFSSSGAFPLTSGSKDSALILSLPPGVYTAVVTDAGGKGGDVLMEVYNVP